MTATRGQPRQGDAGMDDAGLAFTSTLGRGFPAVGAERKEGQTTFFC